MNKQVIFGLQLMVSLNLGLCFGITCWKGEYLHTPKSSEDGTDICLPCKDGTFMAETEHKNRRCNACSKTTSHLEIIITPCNRTRDTEIHCVSGYYRRKAQIELEKDRCEECRICESGFPARPCLGYNDTVCCPLQHDAVWTCEGQYECQERPACGEGMYYNTTFDTCLSCPNGTYMHEDNQTNRECFKCASLSGNSSNHAVILQPCTRTSPTVFSCEDSYFRAIESGPVLEEAPCIPCQKCRREVRQCQNFHDAVCAEDSRQDNDSSVDTGGGQTADIPDSCQVGHPTETLIYQISVFLSGEILLHLLFSCMYVFMRVYTRSEGFQFGKILPEGLKLYYLSLFIMPILLRVFIICYYNGYFGGFVQDNIFTIVTIFSVLISVAYFLYLRMSNYIKVKWNAFWGYYLPKDTPN